LKSRLYALFALLSLTAVFAAPALADPVTDPIWYAPGDGGSVAVTGDFLPLLEVGTAIDATSVEIFIDGDPVDGTFVSLGQATEHGGADTNDWELALDTSGYTPGAYRLRAVAMNGLTASSNVDIDVTFTDLIDPAISSYSPVDGSDVSGSFTFTVTATDNVAATSATSWLDGGLPAAMTAQGGGVFTATVDVTALTNGVTFLYTEVSDAAGNETPGNTSINVLNPEAPALNTAELEYYGSTRVGSEGMNASGATATGHPAPEVTYGWRVCDELSCTTYAGAGYAPIAADVGRTVQLRIQATNGVGDGDVELISIGTVTAADPEPTPAPTPTTTTTSPTPEPTPAPTPVAPPITAQHSEPEGETLVDKSSGDQKVSGTAGPDRIVTGSGDDVIRAGAGNDVISPGKGGGLVYAGPGADVIRARFASGLVVNCGTGKDVLYANKTVKSVGCEQVIVASNNKLVRVQVGADKLPVMPANFISAYSTTEKAPAVVTAEKRAAIVTARVAETNRQATTAAARAQLVAAVLSKSQLEASIAAKLEIDQRGMYSATQRDAAARKADLARVTTDDSSQSRIVAARQKLVAAEAALQTAKTRLAGASAKSDTADRAALAGISQSLASADRVEKVAAERVAVAEAQVVATRAVVGAQAKVVRTSDQAVAAKEVGIVKLDATVRELKTDLANAGGAKEAALQERLQDTLAKKKAEALRLLELEKTKRIQAKLLEEARLKQLAAAQLKKLAETKQGIAAAKAEHAEANAAALRKTVQAQAQRSRPAPPLRG